MNISNEISAILSIPQKQVLSCLNLLNEGATLPFIARYRKEVTGSLTEIEIGKIIEQNDRFIELDKRRKTVLDEIKSQSLLTTSLEQSITNCKTKQELEDIYLPYKPRRTTKADRAREAGLSSLSRVVEGSDGDSSNLIKQVISKLNKNLLSKLGFTTEEEIVSGAIDISAEKLSIKVGLKKELRSRVSKRAELKSTAKKEWREKSSSFTNYYNFSSPLFKLKSHAVLALLRGENEKVLSVKLDYDKEPLISRTVSELSNRKAPTKMQVKIATFAFKKVIAPSIESEIIKELKEIAQNEAIEVFAKNVSQLLLAPPVGSKSVLAIDPGFRTGCKCAVISKSGEFIESFTIFPTQPRNEFIESAAKINSSIKKHKIELIAVGNGTGGRETETFLKKELINNEEKQPIVVTANESGASVYSASKIALEEFGDLDITVRGAISIGRRVQDPLTELIKIEPKSIGVGQYQHDLPPKELERSLDLVVESAVNRVGADLNLASLQLLTHISGLTKTMAKNIIEQRKKVGAFTNREELLKVKGVGKKAFEQCAGFLRISDGSEPLDNSSVHPESYSVAEKIIKSTSKSKREIIGDEETLLSINPNDFVTETTGLPTIKDLIEELKKPARDPREEFKYATFSESVNEVSDLYIGQKLEGVVTNITGFGAFVDIGVHQDGLVHISQLANKFVSDVNSVVTTGQIVSVTVLEVNEEQKRISLSMKS